MKSKFLLLLISLLVFQACDKNNDPDPNIQTGAAGYFVVNEGGFGNNNTSISFYDRTSNVMTNDVFAQKNGRSLGDQTQSLTVFNGKAYIVVQHSGKVEVINADDYSSIKTISDGIISPRYFIGITDTKGYLSDWGDSTVKVINLTTMSVGQKIRTGAGPNEMVMKDGKVYVTNSGGFGNDHTITVIDTNTDAVSSTIEVGENPMSLQFDKNGDLWAASAGFIAYNDDYSIDEENSTESTISKIENGKETLRMNIPGIFYPGVSHLNINKSGDNLYYIFGGDIYSMPVSATATPTTPLIGDKYFYGMAVDPITDDIIGCEVIDFSSAGSIEIYSTAGALQTTYKVGIAPNGVGFK